MFKNKCRLKVSLLTAYLIIYNSKINYFRYLFQQLLYRDSTLMYVEAVQLSVTNCFNNWVNENNHFPVNGFPEGVGVSIRNQPLPRYVAGSR